MRAVYPRRTTSLAFSWKLSGVRGPLYQPLAYTRALSRTCPPRSLYTGTPSTLPMMSQQATSMPEIACLWIWPPSVYMSWNIRVLSRSI